MRAFTCPACRQFVFFENNSCLSCGTGLGFVLDRAEMVAVRREGAGLIEFGTGAPGPLR